MKVSNNIIHWHPYFYSLHLSQIPTSPFWHCTYNIWFSLPKTTYTMTFLSRPTILNNFLVLHVQTMNNTFPKLCFYSQYLVQRSVVCICGSWNYITTLFSSLKKRKVWSNQETCACTPIGCHDVQEVAPIRLVLSPFASNTRRLVGSFFLAPWARKYLIEGGSRDLVPSTPLWSICRMYQLCSLPSLGTVRCHCVLHPSRGYCVYDASIWKVL